jgi:hypothetical protein
MQSIKIRLGRPRLQLNIFALSILFVGYALTIGTGFIANPAAVNLLFQSPLDAPSTPYTFLY